jgi:diguanylate cyclase (GGDEF)-like protein/PAS domain S-box-containing protein
LDSAAEAIYGIDKEGRCTFCNLSCITLLGYFTQEDLLGENMHWKIHHSRVDGTLVLIEECKIINAVKRGQGVHVDDEVFWKADGTCFFAEYYAYPQVKDDEVIGAVITFMDMTDRKKREEKIQYLSNHDTLTGLYNRRYFEEDRNQIDRLENLPLSVIFADINGLKMTNDIFGHAAGDELIKKSAEILLHSCRENDLIARVGGDEFIILLPKTDKETAEKILLRIKSGFSHARVAAIKCSIALGSAMKISMEQALDEVISNAEDAMYQDKTLNRKAVNQDIIDTIVETLHAKSPKEKQHSIVVSELCGEIGAWLHLPKPTINKLKREGFIHDIGKIVLTPHILSKETLSEEEYEGRQQHAVVGYRILNLFDDTLDLAEDVYGHHERWDGKGYPRGLKGEQIPLLSRIISVAERYERILSMGDLPFAERKKIAIKAIKEGAGKQFDPFIAKLFAEMMHQKIEEE